VQSNISIKDKEEQAHGFEYSKKARYILCCLLVLLGRERLISGFPTTIYTPRGSVVPDTWIRDEMSDAEIAYWNWYVEEYYPNAERLSDASRTYNCHAYAWHVSEGGNKVWIGLFSSTAEDIYWNDGSYDQMSSETNATKVSYSGNHSAITTSQSGIYISKWGALPLMRHHKNYCPEGYGSPSRYYRRSVDVPQDYSTVQAAINAAASGQTVHVASGTYQERITMKSGVDVIGAGSGSTTIDGGGGGVAVTFNNVSSRLSGFTVKGFIGVRVQNNTIEGNHGGLLAQTSSDPNLEDGHNTFQSNYDSNHDNDPDYSVGASGGSEPKLGRAESPSVYGNNNFTPKSPPSGAYHVHAASDCDKIYAEQNWWGDDPPDASKIYHGKGAGWIDYDPWRTGPAKLVAGAVAPRQEAARRENELGRRLLLEKKYAEALDHFRRVIEEYADRETALFSLDHLVSAYWEMGKGEEVLPYLEKVARRHPNRELGALALEFTVSNFVAEGEYARAIARAEEIIRTTQARMCPAASISTG